MACIHTSRPQKLRPRPPRRRKAYLSSCARGTDEEVLHGQRPANYWYVEINMHIDSLHKFPARLRVIPVMRSRKEPMNLEVPRETLAEIIDRLHVAVRPVYVPVAMIEVDIRRDECAVVVQ